MTAGSGETAFFDRTYREALALLEEAYAYLASGRAQAAHPEGAVEGLTVQCEALRMSTRIMQAVSWLMVQRAVHEGELTMDEVVADDQFRVGSQSVCRDDTFHDDPALPATLADMMRRSHSLYVRIERLNEMLCRNAA